MKAGKATRGPFRGRIVLCDEKVGLLPEHVEPLLAALRRPFGRRGICEVDEPAPEANIVQLLSMPEASEIEFDENLLRRFELDDLAEDIFETPEEAAAWMRRPHPMLDGESPLECSKSGVGVLR